MLMKVSTKVELPYLVEKTESIQIVCDFLPEDYGPHSFVIYIKAKLGDTPLIHPVLFMVKVIKFPVSLNLKSNNIKIDIHEETSTILWLENDS